MKTSGIILAIAFLLFAMPAYCQPRWSPEVRSERELKWMKDSLHLTHSQLAKIEPVSLKFQRDMDDAAVPDYANRGKKQHPLMRQKDADYKAILTPRQYEQYYRRELIIRQNDNDHHYDGNRQPE